MFFKIGVLKNFVNFIGKTPVSEFLFKKTPTQVFSYKISEILGNTFSIEHHLDGKHLEDEGTNILAGSFVGLFYTNLVNIHDCIQISI